MTTALSGTRSERKTTIRSRNDNASTAPKKTKVRRARKSVKSMLAAAVPVTLTSSVVPAMAAGMTSSRRVFDQLGGGRVLRCGRRDEVEEVRLGGGRTVGEGRRDRGDTGGLGEGLLERVHCRDAVAGTGDDGDHERTVEAGAEAVGEQVVGLAGVGVLGVVALVGEPEAQAEDRRREDERGTPCRRRPRATGGAGSSDSTGRRGSRAPASARGEAPSGGAGGRRS